MERKCRQELARSTRNTLEGIWTVSGGYLEGILGISCPFPLRPRCDLPAVLQETARRADTGAAIRLDVFRLGDVTISKGQPLASP